MDSTTVRRAAKIRVRRSEYVKILCSLSGREQPPRNLVLQDEGVAEQSPPTPRARIVESTRDRVHRVSEICPPAL